MQGQINWHHRWCSRGFDRIKFKGSLDPLSWLALPAILKPSCMTQREIDGFGSRRHRSLQQYISIPPLFQVWLHEMFYLPLLHMGQVYFGPLPILLIWAQCLPSKQPSTASHCWSNWSSWLDLTQQTQGWKETHITNTDDWLKAPWNKHLLKLKLLVFKYVRHELLLYSIKLFWVCVCVRIMCMSWPLLVIRCIGKSLLI